MRAGALPCIAAAALAACGQSAPTEPPPAEPVTLALPAEPENAGVRIDFVMAGGRPFASAWVAGNRAVWEDSMPALERAYALYDATTDELRVVYPESRRWARLEPDIVQSMLAQALVSGDDDGTHVGRPHTVRPVMRADARAIAPCDWVVEQDEDIVLASACVSRDAPPGLSADQARVLHGLLRQAGRLGPALSPIVWPLTRTDLVHGIPLEILDADGGFHLLAQPAQPDPSAFERVVMPEGFYEIDVIAEVVGL